MPASEDAPNIILILADDLGYGDPSSYGGEIPTKNIDRLAAEGMRFTDFHSNGAICSPTRAATLTGRYPQRSGIEENLSLRAHREDGIGDEEVTLAGELARAGYVTALIGKWHLGYKPEFNPIRRGFDVFHGYLGGNIDYHTHLDQWDRYDWWNGERSRPVTGYTTDLITGFAADFIRRHSKERFFLMIAHEAPHTPFQGRTDPPARGPNRTIDAEHDHRGRKDRDAAYHEMVSILDESVGEILEAVAQEGVEGQTLIFFCSDNGATATGSNGALKGLKASLFEGGHRVPAVARWVGKIEPGTESSATLMTMDLFPTIRSLAGAKDPLKVKLDGIDFRETLFSGAEIAPRALFWRSPESTAMREGPWKLLRKRGTYRLYNLAEDLGETRNLASHYPERVEQMQRMLEAWQRDVQPAGGSEPLE